MTWLWDLITENFWFFLACILGAPAIVLLVAVIRGRKDKP